MILSRVFYADFLYVIFLVEWILRILWTVITRAQQAVPNTEWLCSCNNVSLLLTSTFLLPEMYLYDLIWTDLSISIWRFVDDTPLFRFSPCKTYLYDLIWMDRSISIWRFVNGTPLFRFSQDKFFTGLSMSVWWSSPFSVPFTLEWNGIAFPRYSYVIILRILCSFFIVNCYLFTLGTISHVRLGLETLTRGECHPRMNTLATSSQYCHELLSSQPTIWLLLPHICSRWKNSYP